MLRALKWLLLFWKLRGNQQLRAAIGAARELSWAQRASLAVALARDPRVPRRTKLAPLLLVVYFVSPLDLVPDVVPVLGQLDDLAVMGFVFRFMQRSLPPGLIEEHVRRAGERPAR